MAAAAPNAGERGRSWYLSKEEIECGSPSRRDGVGAAKEAQLRATYCSFIRDVGLRLKLPQITIATGIVLCHRFYLHQSLAKNEWQTVATVCIFLASKMEDTPRHLERVVIVAHETMHKKNPVAARRISQKVLLEKRKALILAGEALLLSTIRYDFNIQHPYEPLKAALRNLGISQKEVKQAAINLINDTLKTTLVLQFKPHYIAAGSLSLAARFHNVRLPTERGNVWWHQFDVAPKLMEAAIQQMKELFVKRNPLPASPAIQPTPVQTPMEKQQIVSTTPDTPPIPAETLVVKQEIISTSHAIRPTPVQTPMEKQKILSTTPATRAIPAQTLLVKQEIISTTPAIRPIPALTPVEEQQTRSTAPASRPVPCQTPVEKQQTRSTALATRPVLAQTPVQTISMTPAIQSTSAQLPVEKLQTRSTVPAIRPVPSQLPVEKPQIISTTPAAQLTSAQPPVEKQQRISTIPAVEPTSAQPPVEKQPIISFPVPVLKYTYSRRGLKKTAPAPVPSARVGLKRPTTATTPTPGPAKKQKVRSTPDSVLGNTQSSVGAPARARTPVRKHQIIRMQDSDMRHSHPSVGGERRPASGRPRTPVRKQQVASTQAPAVRHPQPSVGGERRSTAAPARSPARKQQRISTPDSVPRHRNPSVDGERKPTRAPSPAPARSPARKQQRISTPDSVPRHRNPSVDGERKPTRAPSPARARTPVRKQQTTVRHTQPSAGGERRSATAPARSLARKEQIISTPERRHTTHPSQRGLTGNNFDRYGSRCQDPTDSLARNEDSKPLRMHVDHSLDRTDKDGRPEVRTLRDALRADHDYRDHSRPKDVNMTRVATLVSKKRKFQEAGQHPALVNKPDGDAWRRPQIRSVVVAPASWKKQKI